MSGVMCQVGMAGMAWHLPDSVVARGLLDKMRTFRINVPHISQKRASITIHRDGKGMRQAHTV